MKFIKKLDLLRKKTVTTKFGFIFIGITLVVFAGVIYHLTFSTHGPQLLIPLKKKYFTKQQSTILTEAKR